MSAVTHIEWTDATVNWWWGCKEVSEACKYCYARTMDRMRGPLFDCGRVHWGPKAPRWVKTDSATQEAQALNRKAGRSGRLRVFVNSMADTFEEHPQLPEARAILFAEIEQLTNLEFQLLTKRPENIARMVPAHWMKSWPAHVWIGTTVENQARADERIPHLIRIPAKVRFLSCEPLLSELQISDWLVPVFGDDRDAAVGNIHWVICGGESGSEARPMNPDWARSLRDQCTNAKVPFLFKQWGEWVRNADIHTGAEPSQIVPFGDGDETNFRRVYRVGKKAAGRLLDGRTWDEFPNG